MSNKNAGYKEFMRRLSNGFGEITEDIMDAAGFSEQGNGLLTPKGNQEKYPSDFSTTQEGETVEAMAGYYSRGTVDGMVAIKTLIDSDSNLLCAVVSKGIGGTSYYYDRGDKGNIGITCSPITTIDLAMNLMDVQKENTLLSWGALTADFRMLHRNGLAQNIWATLAANHIDMLYQLRIEVGPKINMQLACMSMGITAVEQDARSFKVEEAIKSWKTGSDKDRVGVLDSLRAYCKLLITLYGSVAENGSFTVRQKESSAIGRAPNPVPMEWGRVWEVYKEKWEDEGKTGKQSNSEQHVGINVMHGWLEEHANRSKKTIRQLATTSDTLTNLLSRA